MSNENIHKKEDGSYYVVSANKASLTVNLGLLTTAKSRNFRKIFPLSHTLSCLAAANRILSPGIKTSGNDICKSALLSWGSLFFGNEQLFSMHR